MVGSGLFFHDDENDRPAEIFSGHTTLHLDGAACSLTLPVRKLP